MNSEPVEKLASSKATNSTSRVISSGSAMRGIAKSLTDAAITAAGGGGLYFLSAASRLPSTPSWPSRMVPA